jgi:hypothetical protein
MVVIGAFVLGASCSTGLGRAFALTSEHGVLDLGFQSSVCADERDAASM